MQVLLRRLLACALFAFACRALPSTTPLADTGEVRPGDEGALDRNRVPLAERARVGRPQRSERPAEDESGDEVVEVVASAPDAGDAGAPEAGVEPDAGGSGLAWPGEYFGFDRHATRIGPKPEEVVTDDKAHTRVESVSAGVVSIALVSSGDGSVICSMKARVKAARAELESGEACPGLLMMPPLATRGSATLEGDRLVVDLEASGTFPAGSETHDVRVEYHFDGMRR